MERFRITIKGGRGAITTTVIEDSHDDTAVRALTTALNTYRQHGLSTFPYNKNLEVKLERIEPS